MGSTRIDPYFYKQPPLLFVDELRKPIHVAKPDGDRIGECLQSGHTLTEAVLLTENMRKEWL